MSSNRLAREKERDRTRAERQPSARPAANLGFVSDVGNRRFAEIASATRSTRQRQARSPRAATSGRRLLRLGVAAGSSAQLTAIYNAMTADPSFQELNVAATTDADINLVDSSAVGPALGPVDYSHDTHTIRVPLSQNGVPRPHADVREDLLWEMHNARNRGALRRTPGVAQPLSAEESRTYAERVAASALSTEWTEWIRVVEHDIRATEINQRLGAGHVTRAFAPAFAQPDAGWYLFTNYLRAQLATGHTAAYDPAAAQPNWKGAAIVQRYAGSAALRITQRQRNDFLAGRTKYVKPVDNNPFRSHRPS